MLELCHYVIMYQIQYNDRALIRPGRLEEHVELEMPTLSQV